MSETVEGISGIRRKASSDDIEAIIVQPKAGGGVEVVNLGPYKTSVKA